MENRRTINDELHTHQQFIGNGTWAVDIKKMDGEADGIIMQVIIGGGIPIRFSMKAWRELLRMIEEEFAMKESHE